jgi:hypothetical protein
MIDEYRNEEYWQAAGCRGGCGRQQLREEHLVDLSSSSSSAPPCLRRRELQPSSRRPLKRTLRHGGRQATHLGASDARRRRQASQPRRLFSPVLGCTGKEGNWLGPCWSGSGMEEPPPVQWAHGFHAVVNGERAGGEGRRGCGLIGARPEPVEMAGICRPEPKRDRSGLSVGGETIFLASGVL